MITDEELKIILDIHGYVGTTTPHWPGCYKVHNECAIRWLVATVRELSPFAAKRLETKGIAEETREKELVKIMEIFVEMMQINMSSATDHFLKAHDILEMVKGLPREEDLNPHRKKWPKKKKPAPDTSFDYEQLPPP